MPINSLNIHGFHDLAVPNNFFQPENTARDHLAIIFPGMNYTTAHPGLYYPGLVLRTKGADVLNVDYDYNSQDFQALSDLEQYHWIINDASAAYQTAFAQGNYTQVTLVGKSLGTFALGHLLVSEPALSKASYIWLTPLLRNHDLRRQMMSVPHRGLFVIGTADRHYDSALLAEVERATGGESVVLEGANHSFEIKGKPEESVRIMQRIVEKIQAFVS